MRQRLLASVVVTTLVCFGALAAAVGANWSPKLGLDLEGGLSVVYKPAHPVSQATLQTVVNIMDARVNALGVSQPNIITQGNEIVVQLPGVKDPNAVLAVLGNTAQLFFRPVIAGAPAYNPKALISKKTKKTVQIPYTVPPTPTGGYLYTAAYYNAASQSFSPPNQYIEDPTYAAYPTTPTKATNNLDIPENNIIVSSNGAWPTPRVILGPAIVKGAKADGTIISSASAQLTTSGQWVVDFNLTSAGGTIFNNLAAANYHMLVANDLDGRIISAPVIQSQSFPGSGQISGSFNQAQANNLALDLNYGSLPVQLVQQTSQTVSPSLGKSSLKAGLLAGLLGLLLVMLYTIVYYRALGVVVVLGLVTTAAFLYGIISILGQSSLNLTLDLSGVTGLIVSVGITVDSYIVYFERLKDEVRAGRTIRASVDKSFRSAYRTILSADAVSFLAALVLWLLSVGAVKGFAFMLGLSTLVDVATSYVFTRPLVILLGRNRLFTQARWLGVARGLAAAEASA